MELKSKEYALTTIQIRLIYPNLGNYAT